MESIPVTILGGSDRKPGDLPESGAGLHALGSYKGAAIEVGGRPLAGLLVERLTAAEGFGPVSMAGPAWLYGSLGLDVRIVDTDGTVAENLRAAVEAHRRSGGGALAVMACDVLPSVGELSELRRRYEETEPNALWLPFVRQPDDPSELGAFAWKPTYRVVPEGATEPVRILPGHLGIFDPEALRLPLLYRLFDSAYRTRNRAVGYRRAVMLRTVLLSLIAQDLKRLLALRPPTRTVTVVGSGLRLARALRRGTLASTELERLIGRIFLRANVPPERGIRYPILDLVRLAEDIDTEEEARQFASEIERGEERAGGGSA